MNRCFKMFILLSYTYFAEVYQLKSLKYENVNMRAPFLFNERGSGEDDEKVDGDSAVRDQCLGSESRLRLTNLTLCDAAKRSPFHTFLS